MLFPLTNPRQVHRAVDMFHRCNAYPHAATKVVSLCAIEGAPYLGIDEPIGIPLTQGLLRRTGEVFDRVVLMYLSSREVGAVLYGHLLSNTVTINLMRLLSGRDEVAHPSAKIMWPVQVPTEEYHVLFGFHVQLDGTHHLHRARHVHTANEAWTLPVEELWRTANFERQ